MGLRDGGPAHPKRTKTIVPLLPTLDRHMDCDQTLNVGAGHYM